MGKPTKSIVTNDNLCCVFCGRLAEAEHHLVFGVGRRELAEHDGLKIPICNNCHTLGKYRIHDNPIAEQLSKMLGQAVWEMHSMTTSEEQRVARNEFIRRYGKSWI